MSMGVGININQHPKLEETYLASSLKEITSREIDGHMIARELHEYIVQNYNRIKELEVMTGWNSFCVHLNSRVSLIEGNEHFDGTFEGLGPHGEALIGGKAFFNGSLRILNSKN